MELEVSENAYECLTHESFKRLRSHVEVGVTGLGHISLQLLWRGVDGGSDKCSGVVAGGEFEVRASSSRFVRVSKLRICYFSIVL